jgi:hypothetical protein
MIFDGPLGLACGEVLDRRSFRSSTWRRVPISFQNQPLPAYKSTVRSTRRRIERGMTARNEEMLFVVVVGEGLRHPAVASRPGPSSRKTVGHFWSRATGSAKKLHVTNQSRLRFGAVWPTNDEPFPYGPGFGSWKERT